MPGSTSTTGEGGADVGGGVGSTAADVGGGVGSTAADEECACDVWALSTTRADDEHAASADIVIARAISPPRLPVMECSFRAGCGARPRWTPTCGRAGQYLGWTIPRFRAPRQIGYRACRQADALG